MLRAFSISLCVMQDAAGKLGGNLILSTSASGSSSASNSQPVDRLTIDSNGLASFAGSLTLPSTSSTLTASGDTVLGTDGSQTLTINAATSFATTAPITAQAAVSATSTMSVAGLFIANSNTVLGTDKTQSLTVNAAPTFNAAAIFSSTAPITANAPVTIADGSAFNALDDSVIGTSSTNTMLVYANATFNASVFTRSLQMYSNSSTAGSGAVLGFERQSNGGPVSSGFTLGSILFSGYDGVVQGPTAQIRAQSTVSTVSAIAQNQTRGIFLCIDKDGFPCLQL